MGIFSNSGMEIDCEMDEKEGHFLCRGKRGKSQAAVLMKASKEGMKIIHAKGDRESVDEIVDYMEKRGKVKTKDDL